jgi:hypothetical protein
MMKIKIPQDTTQIRRKESQANVVRELLEQRKVM